MKEGKVMQNMEEIYKQYSNTVYKYLFCLTHNEDVAEDLTQETFAIAVKEINKFKGNCKVSVWLCQIAKHLWYKKLKKENKQKNISFEELENEVIESETTEDIIFKKEENLSLYKNIQKLDHKVAGDDDEFLNLYRVTKEEAIQYIESGFICDFKTIYAIQYLMMHHIW